MRVGILLLFLSFAPLHAAEFKYRLTEDLGTLDWNYGEVSWPVVLQLMEGLTSLGTDARAKPAAAESWKWINPQKTQIAFKIRKTARWSDGKRVCAQHFVDSWTRAQSREVSSPFAHSFQPIQSATAPSCERLVVKLARPTPWLPELVSHWVFFPVRLDLIQKWGKAWTDPAHLVVNGAYRLDVWKLNAEYRMSPNLQYWDSGARPLLIARVVNDDHTSLSLFEHGDLHWMKDVSVSDVKRLRTRPEFKESPSLVEYHLGFDFSDGAQALDRDARCALSLALDRSKIPQILQGGEAPALGAVPEVLQKHSPPLLPFDAERARAAWKKSQAGARIGSAEHPLTLHFYSKDIHIPLVEWIQAEWKRHLGIATTLVRSDGKTYWGQLIAKAPAVFLSGTTATYPHSQAFLDEFKADNRANFGRYSAPDFEKAIERGGVAAETLLLSRDCAIAPLYFRSTAALLSTKWRGWEMNPMGYVYLKDLSGPLFVD